MKFEHCEECSKELGLYVRHTGEPCKSGKSVFALTTEEYTRARMFFEAPAHAD